MPTTSGIRRGGALLAVLWLSAALSAIAFSLATTVRGEAERTSTSVDGLRTYYLATGAIDRAITWVLWAPSYRLPDGTSMYYNPGVPIRLAFPTGEAVVDVIPETAKLNINQAMPEMLLRLLLGLGVEAGQAGVIAQAIDDWRRPAPNGGLGLFDRFYLSQTPSFRARHTSFEEIEELLLVRGVSTDLYHGRLERDPETGRLIALPGLADCLSVYGSSQSFDINSVPQAVMMAVGVPPHAARLIDERRRRQPFRTHPEIAEIASALGINGYLFRIGGNSMFTLRATAQLRTQDGRWSDLQRTAAALIKLMPYGSDTPYHVLRWYDRAWALN